MIRTISLALVVLLCLSASIYGQTAADADEIFKRAFGTGEEPESPELSLIPISLHINGRYAGEVNAEIGSAYVEIDRTDLLLLLKPAVSADLAAQLDGGSAPSFSIDEFGSYGIEAEYDPRELKISLRVPADMRPITELQLRQRPEQVNADDIRADPFSAYINYNSRLEFLYTENDATKDTDFPLEFSLFPNIQVYRWVLETGVSAAGSSKEFSEADIEVEYARLIKDFPSRGLRLAAGTLDSPGSTVLTSVAVDGISIGTEKALSGISGPYRPLAREILLKQPAEVSVYLNGRLLKTARLEAGRHQLLDFPYVGGLNEVEIVVTEQDGSKRIVQSMEPFDADLLEEGETDYAITGGTPQHEFTDPLAAGFVSYGFHRDLTSGLAFQADNDTYICSFNLMTATPVGNFGGAVGVSGTSNNEVGFHGRLRYRLSFPSRRLLPSFALQGEYYDKDYRGSVLLDTPTDRQYRLSTTIGQVLPFDFYAGLSGAYTAGRNAVSDSIQTSMTLLKNVNKNASFSLSLSANKTGTSDWGLQGSLVFSLSGGGGGHSAQYSQDLKTGEGGVSIAYRDTTDPRSWAYTASLQGYPSSAADRTVFDTGAHYTNPYMRASITNNLIRSNSDDRNLANRAGAGLSGALLFAGGHFAASRQIQDSFVLIVPDDELKGEIISVRNSRGTGGTKESTGGVLNFSELISYSPATLIVELPTTSPDMVLENDTITLVPSYRSGITVPVRLRSSVYVEGRLLTLDNQPVSLQAGAVTPIDGNSEKKLLFFTDEEGYFQLHDITAGNYRLELFAGKLAQTGFSIPEGSGSPYRLEPQILPVLQKGRTN